MVTLMQWRQPSTRALACRRKSSARRDNPAQVLPERRRRSAGCNRAASMSASSIRPGNRGRQDNRRERRRPEITPKAVWRPSPSRWTRRTSTALASSPAALLLGSAGQKASSKRAGPGVQKLTSTADTYGGRAEVRPGRCSIRPSEFGPGDTALFRASGPGSPACSAIYPRSRR